MMPNDPMQVVRLPPLRTGCQAPGAQPIGTGIQPAKQV
jgi:hypothetical protein